MTHDQVVLGDGTVLQPDTVLYCTGFVKNYDMFDEDTHARLGVQPDGLHLYRHMLCPAVANLAFIGCEVRCHWVGGLHLYRHMLCPAVAKLAFIGCEVRCHWVGGLHLYRHMLCPAVANLASIGCEVRCHWVGLGHICGQV